ncbi:MAG: hypothetical protein WCC27_02675, partial [Acidobacteriaceae bacterium]
MIGQAPAVFGARALIPAGRTLFAACGTVEGGATFGCWALSVAVFFTEFLAVRRRAAAALPGFCIRAMGTAERWTGTWG